MADNVLFKLAEASQAAAAARDAGEKPLAVALERGTLLCELYAPRGVDPQEPHAQDELYVIARGSGTFVCDGERFAFGPGDALFVAAGVEHRFEEFTDDFETWVVFYGPEGGELSASS